MSSSPTILNERYRLDHRIGRGGFAQVFLATDLLLQRQVAIKVLNPDLAQDPTFLERFLQEARRVAVLDHPNILPVYDFGNIGDTAYLVMPYVAGGPLQHRLGAAGRLGLAETGAYIAQVAAALDYAHTQRIVHCDVKPLNMLLRGEGTTPQAGAPSLFLADFGIAKVVQHTRAASSSQIAGTIAYMAPEVFENRIIPASDIYALGCVLFELLTGSQPYTGPTQQVMFGHLTRPVPALAARERAAFARATSYPRRGAGEAAGAAFRHGRGIGPGGATDCRRAAERRPGPPGGFAGATARW